LCLCGGDASAALQGRHDQLHHGASMLLLPLLPQTWLLLLLLSCRSMPSVVAQAGCSSMWRTSLAASTSHAAATPATHSQWCCDTDTQGSLQSYTLHAWQPVQPQLPWKAPAGAVLVLPAAHPALQSFCGNALGSAICCWQEQLRAHLGAHPMCQLVTSSAPLLGCHRTASYLLPATTTSGVSKEASSTSLPTMFSMHMSLFACVSHNVVVYWMAV
jgi:hypothetical protein